MSLIRTLTPYLKFETVEDQRDGLLLDQFIKKYKIVWVLTNNGTPSFVMSDLAQSKGYNQKDYQNNIQRFGEGESEIPKIGIKKIPI